MPSASTTPFLARPPFMGNHVPFQHLTLSAGAPRPRAAGPPPPLVGVDEVQIAVARSSGLIREAVDLPPHPQLAITGKRRGQGILDLIVESTNRENARAPAILCLIFGLPASAEPRGRKAGGRGWSLRTPYRGGVHRSDLSTDGRLVGTVSRPGGRSPDRIAGSC